VRHFRVSLMGAVQYAQRSLGKRLATGIGSVVA
jgi:hypothetical protein